MVTNGRQFEGRRTVAGKAKGRRFKGMRRVAGKSNGHRFKGMRRVTGKSNGRRFEGRRRVASSKECEGSPGSRMVAGLKECEGSPLRLIGDGWLLTELHRQRLSLIATVGAQWRRWELNGDGEVVFFLTEIWHNKCFEESFNYLDIVLC